jgi:3-hydroxybutyryl-CoA dehydrogenase
MLEIETVAILGAGRDAVRLALLCSLAGLQVRLADDRPGALEGAFRTLRRDVEHALADGLIGREERQRILDGVIFIADPDEAVTGADLAFAAESTDPEEARALLERISPSCRSTALLAARVAPERVAIGLAQPGRVVELRLEDPDALLPRVSVETGPATTDHARARATQFAERVVRAAGASR